MSQTFNPAEALLLVIDVQEKLLPAIDNYERVAARCAVLIRAARVLEIPMLVSEQYRRGLGPTVAPIMTAVSDAQQPPARLATPEPLEKLAFGCLGDEAMTAAIAATGRRQLVLCGIETHVCVLQTALTALAQGYTVFLAEDALGSRRASDRESALRRLAQAGAVPATVEMLIMEALGCAGGDRFKAILPLVREL